MLAVIRRNFILKLLSVALAVLAWTYFNFATNPVITARFDQQLSVPITVRGIVSGYVPNVPEKAVVVTITAPRAGTAAVRPDDVKAIVDVAGHSPGVYSLPIKIIGPHLEVKAINPASVTLSIDRIVTHSYALSVNYTGKLRGALVAEPPVLQPRTITATGPSTGMGIISAVRVDVPLDGARGTIDAMLKPVASDIDGHEVAGVRLTPNLVRVRIPIVKS